jgi:histidinol phosphatase-like PHP family hydrolase
MIPPFDHPSLPFLALYAETHFRFFRYFPSYLFARRPEIIFDAPRRLDPGQDLPVVLIVNDCRRFPVELADCAIAVSRPRSPTRRFDFGDLRRFEIAHPLQKSLRAFVFPLPRSALSTGAINITCAVTAVAGRRREIVVNDNLRTTAKKPFTCYVSDERLPGSRLCSYGDLHMHSHYSQSHVEFGPPLAIIGRMASASGLSFAAITDHSYDLACRMDDYLAADPNHERWQSFVEELSALNQSPPFLIPGEEISCLNEKNRVVHLCGINLRDYLPGTLDGARRGRRKDPQPTLTGTIRAIHDQGGVAFAAHPGIRPRFLQRLLLYRGAWSNKDLENRLDAMQIFNNGFSPSFHRGKTMWLAMLRQGRRVPLMAGNDAHGDFNRFRALTIPFLAISENYGRYMGFGRTGIYGPLTSKDAIIAGIKNGATFLTTGPYAEIGFLSRQPALAEPCIRAISTSEFGPLRSITVYGLQRESGHETIVYSGNYANSRSTWEAEFPIPLPAAPLSYLRAEVACAADGAGESKAYTSPFFLES